MYCNEDRALYFIEWPADVAAFVLCSCGKQQKRPIDVVPVKRSELVVVWSRTF